MKNSITVVNDAAISVQKHQSGSKSISTVRNFESMLHTIHEVLQWSLEERRNRSYLTDWSIQNDAWFHWCSWFIFPDYDWQYLMWPQFEAG